MGDGVGTERTDEIDLVVRSRAGDDEAFRRLYELHSTAIHTVALRLLADRGDAEEATQDTFVAAWRNLDRYRGDSRLSTWMHRICVNHCLGILRRRPPDPLPLPVEQADPAPGPASRAEVRSELVRAHDALARLPSGNRVALVLRDVADLSYDEVADVLGISRTAARSRIHRGRTLLLHLLDDEPATRDDHPEVVARGA